MILAKTEEEIELLRLNNELVSKTLAEIAKIIRPGITTLDLDKRAEEYIRDNGAKPGFLGYNGYPNTLCTSVNSAVVHGIPKGVALKDGDVVSVDCGTFLHGFSSFIFEAITLMLSFKLWRRDRLTFPFCRKKQRLA